MGGLFKSRPTGRQRGRIADQDRTPTFSYRANRMSSERAVGARQGESKQPRRLPSLRGLRWQQVPSLLMGLTITISISYSLTLSTTPRISLQKAQDSTNPLWLRSQADYETTAQHILSRSLLNRTKLTFNSEAFDKQLRQEFPEIATTAATLPLMGRRPIVEIVMTRPTLLLTTTRGTFVIDEQGRAVAKGEEVQDLSGLQLLVVQDQSGLVPKVGNGVLPQQSVDFIATFSKQLSLKNNPVTNIMLPPAASEVQFKVQGQNYVIKASLVTDPLQSAGTYLALKNRLDADKVTPADYIDVRVEEKAYYR